jgi:alpha-L-rhamnosidase
MKEILAGLLAAGMALAASAEEARWVWYPGDWECWLGHTMEARRIERGCDYPAMWPQYNPWPCVQFNKSVSLSEPEEVEIAVEGKCLFMGLDHFVPVPENGRMKLTLPKGAHTLRFRTWNNAAPPALWLRGKTVQTDSSWNVHVEGAAGDQPVGTDALLASADTRPSQFKLATKPVDAVSAEKQGKALLVDFGKETFGYPVFRDIRGSGKARIVYGESKEEAMAGTAADTWEDIRLSAAESVTAATSRAFRFIRVEPLDGDLAVGSVSMLYEYLPLVYRGAFRCSDEEVNRMWDVAAYTLHLTTREFFLDGIKRDRWVWGGDAYQSFLMDYYLFFDSGVVTRTLAMLRGKDPVLSHVNTILDYSSYWFMGVADYYLYTGDAAFVRRIYPLMVTQMDFCMKNLNAKGLLCDKPACWVFIDWAPKPLDNSGACSFQQILFVKALESIADCAEISGNAADAPRYRKMAADLRARIVPLYWNEQKSGLMHVLKDDGTFGARNQFTKYPNIFGLFYGYFDTAKRDRVINNVLLNPDVMPIVTPYMRFYELDALCLAGRHERVLKEMKDYWGGMLRLGATSFWEQYEPGAKDHLAMYGRPFGKSLCHAWGASPLYLLGRRFLGVSPAKPGYAEYTVEPHLGDLEWMEGKVPTPHGDIAIRMDRKSIRIKADSGNGTLLLNGKSTALKPGVQYDIPL